MVPKADRTTPGSDLGRPLGRLEDLMAVRILARGAARSRGFSVSFTAPARQTCQTTKSVFSASARARVHEIACRAITCSRCIRSDRVLLPELRADIRSVRRRIFGSLRPAALPPDPAEAFYTD
jgi:hypothetical protein